MELRSVDPRSLKSNPDNPRKIAADEMSDRSLTASIQAVGILQPPVVRQDGDDLIIIAGARRVRAAINLGLQEILVLVLEQDDGRDGLRSLVENVVRAPMSTVDLWRAIEALTSDNWTPEAIADALAVPVRQVKKLKLLAHIHPAILAQIGAGDMPKEEHLRTIAAASSEEQASVWKKLNQRKARRRVGGRSRALWKDAASTQEPRNSAPMRSKPSASFGKTIYFPKATRTPATRPRPTLSSPRSRHGWRRICRKTASCLRSTTMEARSCRRKPSAFGAKRKKAT